MILYIDYSMNTVDWKVLIGKYIGKHVYSGIK